MLLASMIEAAHTFVQRTALLAAQEGAVGPVSLPAAVYPPFQPQLDRWASFGVTQAPVISFLMCYCSSKMLGQIGILSASCIHPDAQFKNFILKRLLGAPHG